MPWFVKIEKGIVDKTTFDRYVSAHKDYVRDLISQGRAAKTGYWAIIVRDPLIENGCVEYELHEWRIVVE